MSEAQLSNPRKRQCTEQHQLPSPHPSKRQKLLHHSVGYIDTPAFWDSLSKIWLTKHALRELNRRNSLSRSPFYPVHRPITRYFQAKQQKNVRQQIPAADFLNRCTPSCLKDIKRSARHGGSNLSDLLGHPEPSHPLNCAMSSSQSSSYQKRGSSSTSKTNTTAKTMTGKFKTGKTTSSRKSSPYDDNFLQKLNDGDVYQYGYKHPNGKRPPLPPKWEEFNQRIAQYRPSLSPSRFSDEPYEKFVDRDAEAGKEDKVKSSVIPAMLEAMSVSKDAEENTWFGNLDPIVPGISQAQPDYYYGAHPKQLDPGVREELSSHIVHSSSTNLSIVPNFFLEAKGPKGSPVVALRQACHDGAVGARAIHSLQSYRQDELVYDNDISAVSVTYQVGTLKMYGHSVAQPNGPGTRPEYYMHQLNTWGMTGDKETFLKGATAFKNAMDLAKEHRDAAIARANEIAQTIKEEEDTESEDDNGEEDRDYSAQAEPSDMMHSFDCSTSQTFSTLAEDEDEDQDESQTSIDEVADCVPPSTKRRSSKLLQPHRQKRRTGHGTERSSTARSTVWRK